jgi:RNA polymerase sigma-70 factor, ECF subfamily
MLQETLLAAWRGFDEFQGRASLRTWLYRIATNRCLNLLGSSARRPAKEVPPMPEPPPPRRRSGPLSLQPYPDVLLEDVPDSAPRPAARYETREATALAFVAGVQRLPPLQRTALVLRDVLGFSARGRGGLPHLLGVHPRAGRPLGHVPVARPRAARAQRDDGARNVGAALA